MSELENKMERIKNRLIKIHGKIQDTVEDIQDQVQTKIEKSRLASFVSHLSEDRRSIDSDDKLECNEIKSNRIPSVVINEPVDGVDQKEICRSFIKIESNGAIYRSLSDSNLAFDDETIFDSSSDSCMSCLSSSDERSSDVRPRAGSCPPDQKLDVPSSCGDLIEKISNRFPGLRSKGERIHRVL